jgi:hypothetical protein
MKEGLRMYYEVRGLPEMCSLDLKWTMMKRRKRGYDCVEELYKRILSGQLITFFP